MAADERPAPSWSRDEMRPAGRISSMRVGTIFLVLIAIAAAALSAPILGSRLFYQRVDYSFRLTLAVDVDGTTREASGVIRIVQRLPPRWLEHLFNLETHVDGEAVFLDLGNRRNVIETMAFGSNGRGDLLYGLVSRAFHVSIFGDDARLPPIGAQAELVGEDIPTLVSFADVKDPSTARVVRPQEFSEVFGQGVKFRSARIEMTDAPVTREIEKELPLISILRERALKGNLRYGIEFTPILSDFVRREI